jgi:hypothetical protein
MTVTDFAELPELQESDIEDISTSANFKKGRALFDDEKLGELRIEADLISAICTEKSDDVAVPQAQFNANGIINTACTCSHTGGGVCRHRVALLLCVAHTPEKFESIEPSSDPIVTQPASDKVVAPKKKAEAALFEDLVKRDSDELAHMILALVESEPKLKGALRRLMQPRLSEGEIKKVRSAVESQVKKVLKSYDPNFSLVRREIKLQLRSAQSLEAARPVDAGRLFSAILDGLLSGGADVFYEDPSRIFSNAVEECLSALLRIFEHATSDRRVQWLETVCSVMLMKLTLADTVEFSDSCEKILVQATPDEWEAIEKRLDQFLESRSGKRRKAVVWNYSGAQEFEFHDDSNWIRETAIGLKTVWMARNGKADLAREIVMKQGSPEQQVKILIHEKAFDEATEIARKNFNQYVGLRHLFAENLVQAGEWERAKAWAIEHKMYGWLADKSVERSDSDALEHLINFFGIQSDFTAWSRAMDYAKPDEKKATHQKMWQILEERGAYLAQFDIALLLEEVDVVLNLWSKLNDFQKRSRQILYATLIQENYPSIALKVWNSAVEQLIHLRTREAYREAASALVHIKQLMKDAGREADFAKQMNSIRTRFSMLRALHEELNKVGI